MKNMIRSAFVSLFLTSIAILLFFTIISAVGGEFTTGRYQSAVTYGDGNEILAITDTTTGKTKVFKKGFLSGDYKLVDIVINTGE